MYKRIIVMVTTTLLGVFLFLPELKKESVNISATPVDGEIIEVIEGSPPIMRVDVFDSDDIADIVIKRSGDYYEGREVKVWFDGTNYYQDLEGFRERNRSGWYYARVVTFFIICCISVNSLGMSKRG